MGEDDLSPGEAAGGSMYFEDAVEGATYPSAPRQISEAEIVGFAREWDPQPFHVDPVAARTSLFGTLVGSGLHTLMISFRLYDDMGLFRDTALAGVGLEHGRFLSPLYPGDTLQVAVTIVAKRTIRNPARGLVTVRLVTTAEADRRVLEVELLVLVARRPEAS